MLNFFHVKRKSGENPARARRREAQKGLFLYLMPQIRDKPLDFPRRREKAVLQSEYFLQYKV